MNNISLTTRINFECYEALKKLSKEKLYEMENGIQNNLCVISGARLFNTQAFGENNEMFVEVYAKL